MRENTSKIVDTKDIKKYANEIGIDLIGFTKAQTVNQQEKDAYRQFISERCHGKMTYLEDIKIRFSPFFLLPEAKTIIVIALNYYLPKDPLKNGYGSIARYANGRDYHKVLKNYLKKLVKFIENKYPNSKNRICIDSAPIIEKFYAKQAGLGFIGKNTTLITKQYGSYVVLGEILTDLHFKNDKPFTSPVINHQTENSSVIENQTENSSVIENQTANAPVVENQTANAPVVKNQTANAEKNINFKVSHKQENNYIQNNCGTCTRCLDACPTQALKAPYKMDARKCISYLTIENRGRISNKFKKKIGCKVFGCDVCQEVCPYNKTFAKPTKHKDFTTKIAGDAINLDEIIKIKTDQEFKNRFAGSAIIRAKRKGLIRNAKIVKKNYSPK